jgi:hypothetical protein
MASKGIKIVDSSPSVTIGSKADRYWEDCGISPYFLIVRPNLDLPVGMRGNDLNSITERYKINGVGFGNWLTIEDKINYSYSLNLAFYDLNKILRFKYNMGMGILSVTFGARGSGSALAHFEPWDNMINITRYKKGDDPKEERFFYSGGIGSLAHEYGHFLDYFAGAYLSKDNEIYSLTNGISVSKQRTNRGSRLRNIVDDIMELIIWKKPNEVLSNYYSRLLQVIGDPNSEKGSYWIRRNELFARAFEVYCSIKLQQMGIKNLLLVKSKYRSDVYLKVGEMEPIIKKFDELFNEMRKLIQ